MAGCHWLQSFPVEFGTLEAVLFLAFSLLSLIVEVSAPKCQMTEANWILEGD